MGFRGMRTLIVERGALRHAAFDELQYAVGSINKPTENLLASTVWLLPS